MQKLLYIAIGAAAAAAIILLADFIQKDTAASVNGVDIGKDELYEEIVKTDGGETLNTMISNEIIRQEAEKEEIEITQEELDAEMAVYQESYGGEEELQSAVEASGLTMADLTEEMENYLKIEKLIGPDIEISDEEIETYFEENKDSFGEDEEAKLEDHKEEIKNILFDEAVNAEYSVWLAEKQESYDIETELN